MHNHSFGFLNAQLGTIVRTVKGAQRAVGKFSILKTGIGERNKYAGAIAAMLERLVAVIFQKPRLIGWATHDRLPQI